MLTSILNRLWLTYLFSHLSICFLILSIPDNRIFGWGEYSWGQLGVLRASNATSLADPTESPISREINGFPVRYISLSQDTLCVVLIDGRVYCSGWKSKHLGFNFNPATSDEQSFVELVD